MISSNSLAQNEPSEVSIRIRDIHQTQEGRIETFEREFKGFFTQEEISEFLKQDSDRDGLTSRSIEVVSQSDDGQFEKRKYYRKIRDTKTEINIQFKKEIDQLLDSKEEDLILEKLIEGFNNFNFSMPDFPDFDTNLSEISEGFLSNVFNTNRATLGIIIGVEEGLGVVIIETIPESAAEKSGLMQGDLIKGIDDSEIQIESDLTKQIAKKKIGDEVIVHIMRDGEPLAFIVPLEQGTLPFQGQFGISSDFLQYEEFEPDFQWPFSKNKEKKNLLGVSVQEMTNYNGLKVVRVDEGSPAEAAGIKVDDVIVKFDKQKVEGAAHLKSLLEDKSGEAVKIELRRNGKKLRVAVQLGSKNK